ncbi:hypothetical protein JOF46_002860 [Paeniglutamicibacter psychrophenolicus]|uniref:Uncharacterized protein n=1 Tax=Paeniglutamicibacter psychrophenolicus TaxID=257454 RepID=A0ABS4WG69_9MICC|nr:hypothetical protein [Paeniglutamicibacter psychrophenolicus]
MSPILGETSDGSLGRLGGQDAFGIGKQQSHPSRTVVRPASFDHGFGIQLECLRDQSDLRCIQCIASHQWRRGKSQAATVLAYANQSGTAFLYDLFLRLRSAPAIQPGTRRSERRMAGEGQLMERSEDPDPIVGGRGCGFKQKRCFAQVCPTGKCRHLVVAQAIGSVNHGHGIAQRQFGREDIYLAIRKHPWPLLGWQASLDPVQRAARNWKSMKPNSKQHHHRRNLQTVSIFDKRQQHRKQEPNRQLPQQHALSFRRSG